MRPLSPAQPSAQAFFDTNVLVCAHHASERRKRDVARTLLVDHLGAGTFFSSTQVLAEYFSVVTCKGQVPLAPSAAAWLIDQLPAHTVVAAGVVTLRAATRLSAATGLAIWDTLIVATARAAGADTLQTEDERVRRAAAALCDGDLSPGRRGASCERSTRSPTSPDPRRKTRSSTRPRVLRPLSVRPKRRDDGGEPRRRASPGA
jgi:predicted nucleic acid-binding protein